jgi:hypothetical protein
MSLVHPPVKQYFFFAKHFTLADYFVMLFALGAVNLLQNGMFLSG